MLVAAVSPELCRRCRRRVMRIAPALSAARASSVAHRGLPSALATIKRTSSRGSLSTSLSAPLEFNLLSLLVLEFNDCDCERDRAGLPRSPFEPPIEKPRGRVSCCGSCSLRTKRDAERDNATSEALTSATVTSAVLPAVLASTPLRLRARVCARTRAARPLPHDAGVPVCWRA